MRIYELADVMNSQVVIRRYPNQNRRWSVCIEGAEVSERGLLIAAHGNDKNNWIGALADYCRQIEGKTLVLNAASREHRREFKVPATLEM